MEQDRYQKSHKLFVIGLLSLILSLSLFALSFYIMPNLLFGWYYRTPVFIVSIVEWLQYAYNYTAVGASKLVFWSVLLLAIFFLIVTYFCSNRIDDQIYSSELQSKKKSQEEKNIDTAPKENGLSIALKILFFILLIFIAAALFEWFIYTPPQPLKITTRINHSGEG